MKEGRKAEDDRRWVTHSPTLHKGHSTGSVLPNNVPLDENKERKKEREAMLYTQI